MRWDGNDVNFFAYKLAGLEAGKTYKFEWVYCWYNNGDYFIPRVGINKNPVSVITNADTDFGTDENDDVYYQYFYGIAITWPMKMAFHTRKK